MAKPKTLGTHAALFGVGFALSSMHLPLSLELGTTLTYQGAAVRSFAMMLYPLAIALSGLGAVLAMSHERFRRPWVLRAAGVALLSFLLVALRFNFLTQTWTWFAMSAVAHLLTLGAWYLALGASLTVWIARLKELAPDQVGRGWAAHLVGLLVGYALTEPIAVGVGVNAVLLSGGIALVLSPRFSAATLALLLGLAAFSGVDFGLESLRASNAPLGQAWGPQLAAERFRELARDHRLYYGWTRFGQVQVVQMPDGRHQFFQNLRPQFAFNPDPHPRAGWLRQHSRGALYRELRGERVAVVGTGAGRGLLLFGDALDKNVIAIERDPIAGELRDSRSDLNLGVYSRAHLIVADGRHGVERQSGCFDGIIFESSRYRPSQAMLPATVPYFLYTREAMQTFADRLCPDGVIAYEFAHTHGSLIRQLLPQRVFAGLHSIGIPAVAFRTSPAEHAMIVGCRTEACTERWANVIRDAGLAEVQEGLHPVPQAVEPMTDARPFGMFELDDENVGLLFLPWLGVAIALLGFFIVVGLARRRRTRAPKAWNATLWFFLLGLGHAGLQLWGFLAWRTYFQDEIRTMLTLTVGWLAVAAVVSAFATRVRPLDRKGVRVGLVALLLLLTAIAPFLLPHGSDSDAVRWLAGALAMLPGGILLGLFMPLGLDSAERSGLGTWLAADAIGALVAAALVYGVMLPLGIHVYGGIICLVYLLVGVGFRRGSGSETAPA